MFLRTEILKEKKLIGKSKRMSFAQNKIVELWQWFMPRRSQIKNNIGTELYSLEVYDNLSFFINFNPANEFTKWAAIEVADFNNIASEMETLIIPSGLYAVFIHKGLASDGVKTYNYIFREWLPNSQYALDNRPHFAVMGEKYKNNDVNSEEEIWIPVQEK